MDSPSPLPNPPLTAALPGTSRLKSEVWQFFHRLGPELAECLVCDGTEGSRAKKIIKLSKKSTSGMIAHLKAFHKEQYMLIADQKNYSARRARQCANIMIENPCVPPSLFRSESFLRLFQESDWHNFPSHTVMTTIVLPEMLAEMTTKNRADLTGIPVTLLIDSWTSGGARRATLTIVIAYFINVNWEMEGRLVAVKHSAEGQSPSVVQATLSQIISDEQLDVVAVVSDSACNMRRAIEDLNYRNPHCTNHSLSLAVARGLVDWDEGAGVLQRLREFARTLNDPRSVALRATYFKECFLHSIRLATLPSPPSTRWSGEIRLIEAAIEQMAAINGTLVATGKPVFSPDEVALLVGAASVLKPFAKLALELSQEGRLLSESLFVLQRIEKHLDSSSSSPLARCILSHFSSLSPPFFSSSSTLCSVFFDPGAIFHFKAEINWRNAAATISPSLPNPSSSSSVATPHSCLSSRRAALYGNDDSPPTKKIKKEGSSSTGLDAEILLYLEQSLNGVDVTLEALDFWRTNQDKFPNLSLLARRFLSTPPTTIDAEKVLSEAGLLFRKTIDTLLNNGNAEELCMLRLSKMASLRVVSHNRDRVIVPSITADSAPEDMDEAPEIEEDRDTSWEDEDDNKQGEEKAERARRGIPLISSPSTHVMHEVKEEMPDSSSFPSPV